MPETSTAPARTEEQIDQVLQRFADAFSQLRRSPVLHSPAEQGLDQEDVTFPRGTGWPWRAGSSRRSGRTS